MNSKKNKDFIEDAEYGLDSRYKSNKERKSEATSLMEERLKRMKNLSKDQIEALAEPVDGPSAKKLLALSAKWNITIGAGIIEMADDGNMYNTYVVAMPDGRIASHRKIHCFISEHMASGDTYTVFDIPQGAKVGILICYDNNIIENVRITKLMGAEILLAPHQTGGCHSPSPRCMGKIDPVLWENRKNNPEFGSGSRFGSKFRISFSNVRK